ncbi:MAG: beta-lactamase family protein [Verrucomicrobiales bacterium]|jgi:CubicO group peptidase (beta-lactamase class C family)|nr:beta-lactamase family protein [Verrucomicrobiales bacterium]
MTGTIKTWPALTVTLGALAVSGQAQQYQNILQPYIDRGDLPGVVTVVADPERVLDLTCVGWADIENQKPMKADTLFWVASQSKPICGAAAMILWDEGKLDLDQLVANYLPALKDLKILTGSGETRWHVEEPTNPPTVRQVLSHTSGMEWVNLAQQRAGKIDVLPFQEGVTVSAITPLRFQPGADYNYSNQGINIIAAIIEKISGQPYDEFLQQRLFNPLGMTNTTFWPTGAQLEQLAKAYCVKDGKLEAVDIGQLQYPLDNREKRFAEAAGGLFSTPEDLVKFYQMIAGKGVFHGTRILSAAAVAELGKKQTGDAVKNGYGLGWACSDNSMGHSGSHGTNTTVYKNTGKMVLWLVQQTNLPKANEAKAAFERAADQDFKTTR